MASVLFLGKCNTCADPCSAGSCCCSEVGFGVCRAKDIQCHTHPYFPPCIPITELGFYVAALPDCIVALAPAAISIEYHFFGGECPDLDDVLPPALLVIPAPLTPYYCPEADVITRSEFYTSEDPDHRDCDKCWPQVFSLVIVADGDPIYCCTACEDDYVCDEICEPPSPSSSSASSNNPPNPPSSSSSSSSSSQSSSSGTPPNPPDPSSSSSSSSSSTNPPPNPPSSSSSSSSGTPAPCDCVARLSHVNFNCYYEGEYAFLKGDFVGQAEIITNATGCCAAGILTIDCFGQNTTYVGASDGLYDFTITGVPSWESIPDTVYPLTITFVCTTPAGACSDSETTDVASSYCD